MLEVDSLVRSVDSVLARHGTPTFEFERAVSFQLTKPSARRAPIRCGTGARHWVV